MADIVDTLFGPLGKDYCIWFYFLSVFSFLSIIFAIVPAVFWGIKQGKGIEYYGTLVLGSFNLFISYFVNRLLYSMCSGAMK